MKHIILLHYYCDSEIRCYLKIADFLLNYSQCKSGYEFLLLCSSFIQPSEDLRKVFLKIAPTRTVHCRNSKLGHDEGCTAAFWEGMEYINSNYEKDGGFVLWLEADTFPARSNWVDLLEKEWKAYPQALVMGLYVPELKGVFPAHINGGACYAKDFVEYIPAKYKAPAPVVDVTVSPYILGIKRYRKSRAFAFSHLYSLCNDINDPEKVILNGYLQDREEFVSKGIKLLKDPVFLKEEKKRLKQVPPENRQCCRYWNGASRLCYLHDCVRALYKRIKYHAYRYLGKERVW